MTRAPSTQVSLSSLNRHAVATRADVGLPKATVLKQHFATILPEVPTWSGSGQGAGSSLGPIPPTRSGESRGEPLLDAAQADVEAHVAMYTEDTEDALLAGSPDFVLDAIDNINTKVRACARSMTEVAFASEPQRITSASGLPSTVRCVRSAARILSRMCREPS